MNSEKNRNWMLIKSDFILVGRYLKKLKKKKKFCTARLRKGWFNRLNKLIGHIIQYIEELHIRV